MYQGHEDDTITAPFTNGKWGLSEVKPVACIQGQSQDRTPVCLGPGWVLLA